MAAGTRTAQTSATTIFRRTARSATWCWMTLRAAHGQSWTSGSQGLNIVVADSERDLVASEGLFGERQGENFGVGCGGVRVRGVRGRLGRPLLVWAGHMQLAGGRGVRPGRARPGRGEAFQLRGQLKRGGPVRGKVGRQCRPVCDARISNRTHVEHGGASSQSRCDLGSIRPFSSGCRLTRRLRTPTLIARMFRHPHLHVHVD